MERLFCLKYLKSALQNVIFLQFIGLDVRITVHIYFTSEPWQPIAVFTGEQALPWVLSCGKVGFSEYFHYKALE